jgi:glycosyltransferase involved in cell wall biosynthesis
MEEHNVFNRKGWQSLLPLPGNPKVSMIVSAYGRPQQILVTLSSFIAQTYANWECLVVHDGPTQGDTSLYEVVQRFGDSRIYYFETAERKNDWGNSSKEWGSQLAIGDFIGHSNDDNYYAPVYFEWLIHSMLSGDAQFAYCNMIHSHHAWQPLSCDLRPGQIDGGGWIARADIVRDTPWPDDRKDGMADGIYVQRLVERCQRTIKIPGFLFVHN